jgi:hypothetical protein
MCHLDQLSHDVGVRAEKSYSGRRREDRGRGSARGFTTPDRVNSESAGVSAFMFHENMAKKYRSSTFSETVHAYNGRNYTAAWFGSSDMASANKSEPVTSILSIRSFHESQGRF